MFMMLDKKPSSMNKFPDHEDIKVSSFEFYLNNKPHNLNNVEIM